MASQQIQEWIHKMEVGRGARVVWAITGAVAILALIVFYDLRAYRNFSSPEAMDAAQVARNVSQGRGFTTDFIRPFSIYLVQKHNREKFPGGMPGTNKMDYAQLESPHPDLANPPLYPLVLAGVMKVSHPHWEVETRKPFWTEGGHFARYQPEFRIALFNQILMLLVVAMTFLLAKQLFDTQVAALSALVVFGSDALWKFSVSGLSTMFLLLIFLGLLACMVKIETLGRMEFVATRRVFIFAIIAGMLTGAGMLTRYSFGWLIVPVVIFLSVFGGARRVGLAVAAFLTFAVVVSPWVARNLAVSGSFFGTAGYAVAEGTFAFPGTRLMQSLHPDLTSAYWVMPYLRKFLENARNIFQSDLLRLGGGWPAILFFAGMLLGLRNVAARRLRYFILMCLVVFFIVQALGQTQLSILSPEVNTENLLVLLTPLVVMFGIVFFLTMLNQMKVPSTQVRYATIGLLAAILCQPLIATLLPPKISPVVYPPYYPPDIQKISGWMQPDELVMSDIPWAVAWYGGHQCSWTTLNSQYEFVALNDFIKPVSGLYLTLNTMDQRLFTECLQGGVDSWGNFVLKTVAANQLPQNFPLRNFPLETFLSGLFLTDKARW